MGHPFGRLFTLDVPDCIPQFHCEILSSSESAFGRTMHARYQTWFCLVERWKMERERERESGSGEQKEEEKKKCVLCYNASMRHLDCYSWSWPCLPSPPCLICKRRSAAVRSLAGGTRTAKPHFLARTQSSALAVKCQPRPTITNCTCICRAAIL